MLPTEVSLKYLSADADAAAADENAKPDDFLYQATEDAEQFAAFVSAHEHRGSAYIRDMCDERGRNAATCCTAP